MNGKKARRLRKEVYGNLSLKNRSFSQKDNAKPIKYKDGKKHLLFHISGTITADEKRQEYQRAKALS